MLKTLGVQLRASMPVPCQRELACDKARFFKYVIPYDTTNISSKSNSSCRKTEGLLPTALSFSFPHFLFSYCPQLHHSHSTRKLGSIPRYAPSPLAPLEKGELSRLMLSFHIKISIFHSPSFDLNPTFPCRD